MTCGRHVWDSERFAAVCTEKVPAPSSPAMRVALWVAGLVLSCAAVVAAPIPEGWQRLSDRRAHCQVAVPREWRVREQTATSSDQAASATLGVVERISWEESKNRARRILPPVRLIEDRPRRLWFVFKPNPAAGAEPVGWFVSIEGRGYPCTLELVFPDSLQATAKRIVDSLAPHE